MDRLPFNKYSAAGNDFVVFDLNSVEKSIFKPEIISAICNRRNGIGADGILLIGESTSSDFEVEYFNADGSTGSLCGNGARAAVRYWKDNYTADKLEYQFTFAGKKYSAELVDAEVKFKMNLTGNVRRGISIVESEVKFSGDFLDTGSPHFVIDIADMNVPNQEREFDLEHLPVVKWGRLLRHNPEFGEGGTNVIFAQIKAGMLEIRSYERGVENETLACGTGAAAAAILLSEKYGLKPPVPVLTRGGDTLKIDFLIENQTVKELFLQGPAKQTFSGFIQHKKLLRNQ